MGEDVDRSGEQDDQGAAGEPRQSPTQAAEVAPEPEQPQQPPVDRAIARLGGSLGGRSLSVYGILLAGAAMLLILLAIIWITAGDGGDGGGDLCLNVGLNEALARIERGEVDRVRVTYPQGDVSLGPVALRMDTIDGTCHNLQPQGVEGTHNILTVTGAVGFYNETTEARRIDLIYAASESIAPEFLWTQTPTPTETVEPTPTEPVTPTPTATEEPATPTAVPPTETPAATPTVETGTPEASPEASPIDGSPVAPEPPVAPTATETVVPG